MKNQKIFCKECIYFKNPNCCDNKNNKKIYDTWFDNIKGMTDNEYKRHTKTSV